MTQLSQLLCLAELFDNLEDVLVWVKDCDGRYCWVNRAFVINYALAGDKGQAQAAFGPQAIVGKTDYDLSPAFLADQFRLDDEHVLTGKRIVNRIELVGQPDGLTVWNVTNKIPLFDMGGVIIGTAGITRRLNSPEADTVPGPNLARFWPTCAIITLADHQRAARAAGAYVGTGFRAEVPCELSSHTAEIPAEAADAHGQPGACLYPRITGESRSLAADSPIRATLRVNFAAISAARPGIIASITAKDRRCRFWHKFCRWCTITDSAANVIFQPSNPRKLSIE